MQLEKVVEINIRIPLININLSRVKLLLKIYTLYLNKKKKTDRNVSMTFIEISAKFIGIVFTKSSRSNNLTVHLIKNEVS